MSDLIKTTEKKKKEIDSFKVLKAEVLKVLARCLREICPMPFSWILVISGNPWHSLGFSLCMAFSLCPNFPLLERISVIELGPTLIQCDCIFLLDYIGKDSILKENHIQKYQGLRLGHVFFEKHNSTLTTI